MKLFKQIMMIALIAATVSQLLVPLTVSATDRGSYQVSGLGARKQEILLTWRLLCSKLRLCKQTTHMVTAKLMILPILGYLNRIGICLGMRSASIRTVPPANTVGVLS